MSTEKDTDIGMFTKRLRSRSITIFVNPDLEKISNAEREEEILKEKVFNNVVILDSIFNFSELEDIKRFRLVSRRWNSVAIPFLKKLSAISFRLPGYSLHKFNRLFRKSKLGTEFTAVKLTNTKDAGPFPGESNHVKWKLSTLTQLLESLKRGMKELTIDELNLGKVSYSYPRPQEFDISPYIELSLTKLYIKDIIGMIISTDRCVSTKILSLVGCRLRIVNGVKISPVELKLQRVWVQLNENDKASLNEFVNFDKLKHLSLDTLQRIDDQDDHEATYLSLHFRDPVTTKRVELTGGTLDCDFKNAKWKVTEKLSLSKVVFSSHNEMEVLNLEFKGALLDLAVLPRNLKRLKISDGDSDHDITKVVCSSPIDLSELEVLNLHVAKPYSLPGLEFQCISLFKNCINLTTVMLEFVRPIINFPCRINIATLPKSVRNIYINGNVQFSGKKCAFQLEQLHVLYSEPYSLNSILPRFKGEELAVDLRYQLSGDSAFQTVMNISELPFERIIVAFDYDEKQEKKFKGSPLSQCTDKLSRFYTFSNGFGKTISESTFQEIFEYWEKMFKD